MDITLFVKTNDGSGIFSSEDVMIQGKAVAWWVAQKNQRWLQTSLFA